MACGETDVLAAGRDLGYPVVLKATASERVDVNGRTRPGGAPRYARSPEALARAFAALAQGAAPMLVQEFVAGAGAGYFALLRNGELRAEFGHRRLRDVRPTGSGSAVRESVAVEPGLRDRSLALLRALDWHGVAMVEFKVRADGVPVFLEVNGRFWNSLALAVYAGVDFPALLAQLAEHGDCDHVTTYRAGVRCRWLLGDARHVAAVMVGPPADFPGDFPRRIPTLLSVLRPVPGMRHDNFTIDDPLPGVGDWLHFFLRRLPAAARARYRS
jgi:predicted ATP-grasp superfamily ATP-dependent carboligase